MVETNRTMKVTINTQNATTLGKAGQALLEQAKKIAAQKEDKK